MTDIVRFSEAEVANREDFERISVSARSGDDALVGGSIAYPRHWARFSVSAPNGTTIRVSPGHFFEDAVVYDHRQDEDISLLSFLPLVEGDERYVAILVRGVEESVQANRMIETDVDTGDTVQQSVPKYDIRKVEFVVQQGLQSPPPALRPSVPAGDCCVCFVRLDTTGIAAIEAGNDWRVQTLYEVNGRVTVLEGQMVIAFQRTTTLQTDLANLQARFTDYPRPEIIRQLQRDTARTRRILGLPEEARGYFYDPGLVKDKWGLDQGEWLARIDEGIRFAWASVRDDRMEMLDPGMSGVTVADDVLMPSYTEVNRISVTGSGGTRNIAGIVHTVTTAHQHTVSRSSVSYGPTVAMCDNIAEWADVGRVRAGGQFQAEGETFEKLGVIDSAQDAANVNVDRLNQYSQEQGSGHRWDTDNIVVHNALAQENGHNNIYAARSVQVSSWSETYWTYTTETFGLNGSVYGQTFLNSQAMVVTSIDLEFTRVGSDGPVTLLLCEVGYNGAPRFDKVIARSTLQVGSLAVGWVKFPITPKLLEAGKRFAWLTVTTGNHQLRTVTGNQFTEGTLFWTTDNAWFQGSPEEDFAFRVNAAQFAQTRVVVEMVPVTLEGGMTQINLLYEAWVPEGTQLIWEVKTPTVNEWLPIRGETAEHPNPLIGLPAICQLRCTMIGTRDLAPGLALRTTTRVRAMRPRADAVAVTKPLLFGFSSTSIVAEVVMDAFNPDWHDCEPELIIDGVTVTPTTISIEQDVQKGSRFIVKAQFALGVATNTARLRIKMSSSTTQRIPFVENTSLYAA
jgi:hypothetical protein